METFLPIIRYKSLRIFLAIAIILGIIFIKINIISTYLESAID